MTAFTIRPEQPDDVAAITRVHKLAFQAVPHSGRTEHLIVLALRDAGALSVSLVAERLGWVGGHVAFSPVWFSDGSAGWQGLGPVAVVPELQHQGMGSALIRRGLASLRATGASGCAVLGDPEYYGRFGFKRQPGCVFEGMPTAYFQLLAFGAHCAKGSVMYHEAFGATG